MNEPVEVQLRRQLCRLDAAVSHAAGDSLLGFPILYVLNKSRLMES